jgi:hypothetical protein
MQSVGDWNSYEGLGVIRNGKPLRFVFLGILRRSADRGLGLGLGLGDPRVTQASRKGRPSVTQGSIARTLFACNGNEKMTGGGRSPRDKVQ